MATAANGYFRSEEIEVYLNDERSVGLPGVAVV
jgi:hypothetical protein